MTVISNYAILAFLTVLLPALYTWGLVYPDAKTQVPSFLIVPWLLIMVWNWIYQLSRPHQLEIRPDRTIAFVSVLRTLVVPVADLVAIRPGLWGQGEPVVRYLGGRIRLLHDYYDFPEFKKQVMNMKPDLNVVGRELAAFP
jgi:hypothetical protein